MMILLAVGAMLLFSVCFSYAMAEEDQGEVTRVLHIILGLSLVGLLLTAWFWWSKTSNSPSLQVSKREIHKHIPSPPVSKLPKDIWAVEGKICKEKELRIVLLGKTGNGKSATGNTILGKRLFKDLLAADSETKCCEKHETDFESRQIQVTDVPGLCDTDMKADELKKVIEKCVEVSAPGPHAFLLVIRADARLTQEERDAVKWIQENFGEEAVNYTLVLFTHKDALGEENEESFLNRNKAFLSLIKTYEYRCHFFDNKCQDRQGDQVDKLLDKIDRIVHNNGGTHYTNEMYIKAQSKINISWKRVVVGACGAALGAAAVAEGGVAAAAVGALLFGTLGAFTAPAVVAVAAIHQLNRRRRDQNKKNK